MTVRYVSAVMPDRVISMHFQMSLINNSLKLGLNELKLLFRARLSAHLYDEYLK